MRIAPPKGAGAGGENSCRRLAIEANPFRRPGTPARRPATEGKGRRASAPGGVAGWEPLRPCPIPGRFGSESAFVGIAFCGIGRECPMPFGRERHGDTRRRESVIKRRANSLPSESPSRGTSRIDRAVDRRPVTGGGAAPCLGLRGSSATATAPASAGRESGLEGYAKFRLAQTARRCGIMDRLLWVRRFRDRRGREPHRKRTASDVLWLPDGQLSRPAVKSGNDSFQGRRHLGRVRVWGGSRRRGIRGRRKDSGNRNGCRGNIGLGGGPRRKGAWFWGGGRNRNRRDMCLDCRRLAPEKFGGEVVRRVWALRASEGASVCPALTGPRTFR
jgi:hypothetical protein